jgi:tetratricopeptide (TPR) repeat protein
MNHEPQSHSKFSSSSLEEPIDILFRELELAAQWERPSILFAIYRSESIRDQVMAELENRLKSIGQKVQLFPLKGEERLDFVQQLSQFINSSKTILFLDGFRHDSDPNGAKAFEEINKYREYFIDNSLRAVFWLFEKDVQKFAARATECWYLRHRVIDLIEEIQPSQLFLETLDAFLQTREPQNPQDQPPYVQQEIESLSEELPLQTSHAATLCILGLLCSRRNDDQNALIFLRNALEISKTTTDNDLQIHCLKALAVIQAKMGNTSEAICLYKQAIPLSAETGPLWKNIGLLLSMKQEHQEAVDAFLNAVKNSHQDHSSWTHLGYAYFNLGQFTQSISAFETALELFPSSDAAWAGLGETYLSMEETDSAIVALQNALQMNPKNTQAWFSLGEGLLQQKKLPDAIAAYHKATEADPENIDAWSELGHLYLAQKQYDNAISALENAIRLQPESGQAYQDMGIAEFQRGNYTNAAFLFQQAIPLSDNRQSRSLLWNYLAETHLRLNNDQIAISAFKQADLLAESTVSPSLTSSLSHLSALENSPQENGGRSMLESTHTFENRTAKEWNDLGNSFLKSGDYKKAVFAYTKAIEMASENSWPYIKNLAVANYQMGKKLGKRMIDQPEDADLWEIEEEEETILYSANDNIPLRECSELHSTSDEQISLPNTETALAIPISHSTPSRNISGESQDSLACADDWNEKGNEYASSGDFEKAIAAYKQSIQTNPQYGKPYCNLGFVYFKKGDYRLAVLLYQKSLERLRSAEDKASTLNKLGDAYRQLHDYKNALLAYKKAEELAPSANPILARARLSLLQSSIG